jgi:hypothetical protein
MLQNIGASANKREILKVFLNCKEHPSRMDQLIYKMKLYLCKVWGFHGGDYEECHLLGHKNPVLTSQVTHYVSATEPSRLKLRKI